MFGTKCTFYNEKMPKLYTIAGGIFSILSILACILIFIIFSLDDLKRKNPITTISSIPSEGYRKIKFGKEKIWIPWSIVDYNNKFVNHTGLLFPIIYYYSGIKDIDDYKMTKKILNYKLCNETSMAYDNTNYQITVPLSNIYCIEMDDLDMGGSWITEYINYIEFDLYYCEDGINYDENNIKCTSYNKIKNFIGENNSLDIAVFYPIVQFQSTNKTNPVIVIYKEYFYHLSRYSYKIERLFLEENVLTDDSGWILSKETNKSYWGLSDKDGDSYLTGDGKDLMNEGSNSRAYSFNLYLEPGIIHYKRYYKKLYTIFSDFFPVAYIIFIIMKTISKLFKNVENNKKMVELLFENLKEKANVFEENLKKLREQNNRKIGKLSFNGLTYKKYNNNNINNKLKKQKLSEDFILRNHINIQPSALTINKNSQNNNSNDNNYSNNSFSNKLKKRNSKFYEQHKKSMKVNNNNNTNQNLIVKNYYYNLKSENDLLKFKNNNKYPLIQHKKEYIKEKLFPYKYYLFSVFIKNLTISKRNCFFSQRFSKIYTFLSQLFDITTYLSLIREFNALKKIFDEKNVNLIEKNKKININSNSFIKDINDCIGGQKFYILAQGLKNN